MTHEEQAEGWAGLEKPGFVAWGGFCLFVFPLGQLLYFWLSRIAVWALESRARRRVFLGGQRRGGASQEFDYKMIIFIRKMRKKIASRRLFCKSSFLRTSAIISVGILRELLLFTWRACILEGILFNTKLHLSRSKLMLRSAGKLSSSLLSQLKQ